MAMTRHGEEILLSEIMSPHISSQNMLSIILVLYLFGKAKEKFPGALYPVAGKQVKASGSFCDLSYMPRVFVKYLKNEDKHG